MVSINRQAAYAEHLMKNSQDFIGAADENGFIIEYNPAALRAFGYTKEEMEELHVRALYATDDDFKRVVKQLSDKGEFKGEVRNRRKNGEEFICHLTTNIMINEEGHNVGTMSVSRDISHEKELAKQLELQNVKNKKLIDELVSLSRIATKVSNGIVITDPDGRMKWCNDSFSRITGYSNNELIGFKPSELFRVPHFFKDSFEQISNETHGEANTVQVPHYHKDGTLYWILVESTPVHNEEGELTEIIEICTEITGQKKAEMALVESETNFRQMSETIEDVFFLFNVLDKEYEYVSPNSAQIMGLSPDFFYAGKDYLDQFVHKDDRHLIRRGRLDIINGRTYDIEYRIEVEGHIKWLHERAFPFKDESGQIIKASGVVSDITQLKKDQELIDRQNFKIAESISYAQHIQQSTIQDIQDVKLTFEDSFVFFSPKDELSGDFYITGEVVTDSFMKLPVFVVGDCTGHGVPGAILSILCISLMRQTFWDRDINSPAEALGVVRNQLAKLFYSGGESLKIKDGMDVGIGVLYKEKKQLVYSGAMMNAFIYRDKSWIELKGSKQHVGYSEKPMPFKNIVFDYQTGDQLYMFTDGFVDQFGGANNKKYMKRKLMKFVASIAHEPMDDQRKMIEEEFLSWKGNEEQTDDICCFGFKFD